MAGGGAPLRRRARQKPDTYLSEKYLKSFGGPNGKRPRPIACRRAVAAHVFVWGWGDGWRGVGLGAGDGVRWGSPSEEVETYSDGSKMGVGG